MSPLWCSMSPEGEMYFELSRMSGGRRISFTQKDVRAVQLAKAAIRACFMILLSQAGAEASDIAEMHVAGGFGFNLSPDAAVRTGMLPEEVRYRIISDGNTSLKGAAKMITGDIKSNLSELGCIISAAVTSELNEDPEFEDIYIKNLNFE